MKWLVQLRGPVKPEHKVRLVQAGARLGDYVPDFSFIASMTRKDRGAVEQLDFVRGVIRLKPAYKIHPRLKDGAGRVRSEKARLTVHVRLDHVGDRPLVTGEVQRLGGKIQGATQDQMRVELTPAAVSALAGLEEVISVDEVLVMHLFNDITRWVIQSGVTDSTPVWEHGLHGENQIIGLGDTGIDYDMPFFRDPDGNPIGSTHRKLVAYDTTWGDDYDFASGHGTHVAGALAGDRTPVDGSTTGNGMAPKARIYFQDLTPGTSNNLFLPEDLGDLFAPAYAGGARLHSDSWGATPDSGSDYNSDAANVDRYLWQHKDFLAVFAAGNSGPGQQSVVTPGTAKNVVTVGANGYHGFGITDFSSRGPTADGRLKPTVVAPGDSIVSASSDGLRDSNNSGLESKSGTSMATPAVAGAAALVRQYFEQGYYPTGLASAPNAMQPSAALVKATLINSARDMGDADFAHIPSGDMGWGRVTLADTLAFEGGRLTVRDEASGLQTGESTSTVFASDGTQPLKVTLAWSDYPALAQAGVALVNDLDLTVVAPDGTGYVGNSFADGHSIAGGTADRRNVEEQVLVSGQAGAYRVVVSGYNVPSGPQPYALVVRGAVVVDHRGVLTLDRGMYRGTETIQITLRDSDLDVNPAQVDVVSIIVKSGAEPQGETVVLTETGPHTGLLTGQVALMLGEPPVPGDGKLTVSASDTITAIYQDANDGSGNPAQAAASANIDSLPCVISAVTVETVTDTTARITWTTDKPARSHVIYGEQPTSLMTSATGFLSTAHSIDLTGLREGASYIFSAVSITDAGVETIQDDVGGNYAFTTLILPPTVSISSGLPNQTTNAWALVRGVARDPSGIQRITINDHEVTFDPATEVTFSERMRVNLGDNTFTIVVTDAVNASTHVTFLVKRLPPPDFTISMQAPAVFRHGIAASIQLQCGNQGPGDVLGPYGPSVWVYRSSDAILDPSDTLVDMILWTDPLPNSGSATYTRMYVPDYAYFSTGPQYLIAVIDPNDSYFENGEDENNMNFVNRVNRQSNNVAVAPINVLGPELTIAGVSNPVAANPGDEIDVTVGIRNDTWAGNTMTPTFFSILLSSDPDIGWYGDTSLGQFQMPGLIAYGTTATGTFKVRIPMSISGRYFIGAIVSSDRSLVGSDSLAGNEITIGPPPATPFVVRGSDALGDPIRGAIAASGARLGYSPAGSGVGEDYLVHGWQSIAPMSRELRSSVASAHPAWTPEINEVIGLDAVVVVEKSTGSQCGNIDVALGRDGSADQTHDNLVQLILGGKGGEGTLVACSHPDRLAAIQNFAACNHVQTIEHFYRPDDNSGEAEILKQKLHIKRFCNGSAFGGFNRSAQDNDPIRRTCKSPQPSGDSMENCTIRSGDYKSWCPPGSTGCTQGLVVALSEVDPGSTNVTTSIANRVKSDSTGASFGFASRQAVMLSSGQTVAARFNTISPSNFSVRHNAYLLSRRLLLVRADDYPTTSRNAEELKLYQWATARWSDADPDQDPGRCKMDRLLVQYGLITCTDDCYEEPSGPSNLCSLGFVAAVESTHACMTGTERSWRPDCRPGIDVSCNAGEVCTDLGLFPPKVLPGAGYACWANADCMSGVCQTGALSNTCE